MADEPTPEPEPKDKPEPKGGKGLNGKIGGIPKKYLLIAAVAGLGIGLYLRNKNKAAAAAAATTAPAPHALGNAATDTGTGSSPGGGGFISYPSFVTGGDLAPQPTPAPIASIQPPQTFTGSTPTPAASVGSAVSADHGLSTQITGPVAPLGPPVPLGVSPQQAVAAGIVPQPVAAGQSLQPVAPSPTQQPNYQANLYSTPVTADQGVSYPFTYG